MPTDCFHTGPISSHVLVALVRDKEWPGTRCHFFVTSTCTDMYYTLVFKQDMQFVVKGVPELARLFVEFKALPKYDCEAVASPMCFLNACVFKLFRHGNIGVACRAGRRSPGACRITGWCHACGSGCCWCFVVWVMAAPAAIGAAVSLP